jgi:tetratricopeptide (TPR) repeat protein
MSLRNLLGELLRESRERRLFLARNHRRFRNAFLCRYAMREGFQLRYEDAAQMLAHAEIAAAIADGLRAADLPLGEKLADLRAEAYAHLGNALKVSNRLKDSRSAFDRANLYLTFATPPLVAAQVFTLEASYFDAVRSHTVALDLLCRAAAIYRMCCAPQHLARVLIQTAIIEGNLGRPARAVRLLQEAEHLIESRDLALSYLSALSVNLLECDYPQEAEAVLYEFRKMAPEPKDPLVQLRILWTEARINANTGSLLVAEGAFREVRSCFLERSFFYESSLVGIEHAHTLAAAGRGQEAAVLLSEIRALLGRVGFETECGTEALAIELLDRAINSGCDARAVLQSLRAFRCLPRGAHR